MGFYGLSDDGNVVATSAHKPTSSYAKVYYYSESDWVQKGTTLTADNNYDNFGRSIDLNFDGTLLIIGPTKKWYKTRLCKNILSRNNDSDNGHNRETPLLVLLTMIIVVQV